MKRVKFQKGKQREFFRLVLERLNCPSLKELVNRGIEVSYSSLKNYYSERRLIPLNLFLTLLEISGINQNKFRIEFLDENWGKVKGGKN